MNIISSIWWIGMRSAPIREENVKSIVVGNFQPSTNEVALVVYNYGLLV